MRALLVILSVMAVACSPSSREVLVVSAASSLTEVFAEMEEAFEAANPKVDVVLNLAGSSALREQILGGAPTAVFASADESNMDLVASEGLLAEPARVFAINRLQIAVPSGNPAGVSGLADFSRRELFLGLCAEGVPCGDLARVALERAGVVASIDTNEPDVRSLLAKVESGDLDAGITYVTDVTAARNADGVDIDPADNVLAEYHIAALRDGEGPATAFVDFVLSPGGQEILTRNGFDTP